MLYLTSGPPNTAQTFCKGTTVDLVAAPRFRTKGQLLSHCPICGIYFVLSLLLEPFDQARFSKVVADARREAEKGAAK